MKTRMMTLAVLTAFSGAAYAAAGQVTVTSPNGRAAIKIARDGGSYVVTRGGEPVLWDFGSAAVHLSLLQVPVVWGFVLLG